MIPINRNTKTIYKSLTFIILLFAISVSMPLQAKVSSIDIQLRKPFAEGKSFGAVGQYELIKGTLHYLIDPALPGNRAVVDLQYAPRNNDGMVAFSGEFMLLKPVDLSKGNHRLLYDVNNRGNLVALLGMNDAPFSNLPLKAEDGGNGFLMREGYSCLWSAWNWDVIPGSDRLQIQLPIATDKGKPISQKIAAEIVLSFAKKAQKSQPLAWGSSRCYPPIAPDNKKEMRLTVRNEPRGKRLVIPVDQWQFARWENGVRVPDNTSLMLETGFQPGKIYELIYTVKDPRIVGLGLTAARDAISFFRFDSKDQKGNFNPLAVNAQGQPTQPDPQKAYIFGVSQSGRFITHMIYQGFHVDESARMVFEGARIHVAGGGKGGFNFRFAQTTHHPSHLEGNYMPADFFPFNFGLQVDPVTGRKGDVLAVAKKLGKVPYIIITNNELEYWTRSASLIHTDVEGKHDAPVDPNVRIYLTCGAPHRDTGSRSRYYPLFEHSLNPINHYAISRALMRVMDQWVTNGTEPPASRYPMIKKSEMLTSQQHKEGFPKIPGMRHPGTNLKPPRVDYGPGFWEKWIMTNVPPVMGQSFQTLVPAFDKDGNSIGGIRLPQLTVPLGTYQGWNPRRAKFGAPNYLGRFEGSFWPFELTEKDRKATKDPRPSIEARYSSKEVYINKIKAAVQQLMKEGFLLNEDALLYIKKAQAMQWPPQIIDGLPYWKSN
jgi:Alpha/beta hydrolase domain